MFPTVAYVQFPAFCPRCGAIIPSPIAIASGVQGTTFKNVKVRCACGGNAEIPDGTFDVIGDTITLLSGPELTRERLRRLQLILDAARTGEMSADDAMRAVQEADPAFATLIEQFGPTMRKVLIFFLLAVINSLLAFGTTTLLENRMTTADIERAVEQALEYCQANPPSTKPDPPQARRPPSGG